MGSIKEFQGDDHSERYWPEMLVTLTPTVLHGDTLSPQAFIEEDSLKGQSYDISLLNRILKQGYKIDKSPRQWSFSWLCQREGMVIHYAYPTPNDRLYYHCRNDDMPLHIRADSRLIGIASTIVYHLHLYANSQQEKQKQFHKDIGRHLRDYCQYQAGSRGYNRFNNDLFEMLLVDFPPLDIDDPNNNYS